MTPLHSSLGRCLLLPAALLSLTSCGLLVEGMTLQANKAREMPAGTMLTGDGFTLRTPKEGLHSNHGEPAAGGITLRPTHNDFGEVCFVTPFKNSGARNTDEALAQWNQIPRLNGRQVVVLRQSHSTFAGLPATRAVMDLPHPSQGSFTAMLVVKRSGDFLILATGGTYFFPPVRESSLAKAEKDLLDLQRSVTLTRR